MVAEGLSVRELEKLTATGPVGARGAKKPRAERSDIPEAHLKRVIEVIQQRLGTSIRLTPTRTLANGKRADVYLFGVFLALALIGIVVSSARGKFPSHEPRIRPDVIAVIAGMALYAFFLLVFHPYALNLPVTG